MFPVLYNKCITVLKLSTQASAQLMVINDWQLEYTRTRIKIALKHDSSFNHTCKVIFIINNLITKLINCDKDS